ncbi:MAG: protein kinase [Chthoniobacterales bacterium]|nr:protein kinase [Chthoniobacterales bacterium]
MENKIFLNRYRLSRGWNSLPVELHRTPTATMYRGQELESGREMAIELVPWSSTDPGAWEQLEAEATAAKQISHINIPKLYDFGIEDGQLIYVTEYFDGHTAEAWVAARGPLPAAAALRVAVQIADALRAASFHHLSHRALCPANIVFVPDENALREWPAIKVLHWLGLPTDFAEAREGDARLAAAARFASPEQLRGKKVDFPSATYSLGCTMWFLLTGARPAVSVPMKEGTTSAPADVEKLRGVPKIVRHLLGRMLRHNPDERPQDPVALSAYLQTCLARVERRGALNRRLGLPAGARPRLAEAGTTRRWPTKSLAAAAILLLCAAFAALAMPQYFHAPTIAQANTPAVSQLGSGLEDSPARPAKKASAQQPKTTSPVLTANSARAELPPNQLTAETNARRPRQTDMMSVTSPTVAKPPPEQPIAAATHAVSVAREKTGSEIAAEPAPPEEGPKVAAASPSTNSKQSFAEEKTTAGSTQRDTPNGSVAESSDAPSHFPAGQPPAIAYAAASPPPVASDDSAAQAATEPSAETPPPEDGPEVVTASPSANSQNNFPKEEAPAVPTETDTSDGSVAESSDSASHFLVDEPSSITGTAANSPPIADEDSAAQSATEPKTEETKLVEEVAPKKSANRSVAAASASRKKRNKAQAKIAHTSRRNKAGVAKNVPRARKLPTLRVGSTRAELIGTTSDGKWILSLASSDRRVIVPPPPGFGQ